MFGFTAGTHDHTASDLVPWTVVHLHGGRTMADSDGWPENGAYVGQSQFSVYGNAQPGTMLWYHDHAMAITRLNVFAGLAGLYIIRDPREKELGLPIHGTGDHERHELPLVIQDRALTCSGEHGTQPGGWLLHKTGIDTGIKLVDPDGAEVGHAPMEFFGPVTLVNGAIWPKRSVDAEVIRLRLLNGSNARTYRLRFTHTDGSPANVPMQQIGSDGGLLFMPVDLRDAEGIIDEDKGVITLASSERVDVLVDLRGFPGENIEIRNTAAAPFGTLAVEYCVGAETPDSGDVDSTNFYEKFVPFPQVLRLDVGKATGIHTLVPAGKVMLPSARPWTIAEVEAMQPAGVEPRRIALVETAEGFLLLREMKALASTAGVAPQDLLEITTDTGVEIYELLPSGFSDTVRIFAKDGDVELWKIYNVSADTHPFHIHLVQFKLLERQGTTQDDDSVEGYSIKLTDKLANLHPGETGWKDSIRVNPREIATLAVPFRKYSDEDTEPSHGTPLGITGRYMYHCHILEHEDHEMMRPFVVLPPQIHAHMGHHMHDVPEHHTH